MHTKKQIIVAIGREHAYQRAGNAEFGERLGAFLLLARLIEIGGEGIFNTVITGPGHVYLQTMPISQVAGVLRPFMPTAK